MVDKYKSPTGVLEYIFDWTSYLDSDEISTISVSAETGLDVVSSSNTAATVTAWVSGGTLGKEYALTCQVVTTGGRTYSRTIYIHIIEQEED